MFERVCIVSFLNARLKLYAIAFSRAIVMLSVLCNFDGDMNPVISSEISDFSADLHVTRNMEMNVFEINSLNNALESCDVLTTSTGTSSIAVGKIRFLRIGQICSQKQLFPLPVGPVIATTVHAFLLFLAFICRMY